MAKKDMKSALGASLRAEERAVRSRFEKAETTLSKKQSDESTRLSQNGVGKVIRDSFTIPAGEYELISQIKKRCMKAGVSPNKSEVLRAGLAALNTLSDNELIKLFAKLKRIKTGRPPGKV